MPFGKSSVFPAFAIKHGAGRKRVAECVIVNIQSHPVSHGQILKAYKILSTLNDQSTLQNSPPPFLLTTLWPWEQFLSCMPLLYRVSAPINKHRINVYIHTHPRFCSMMIWLSWSWLGSLCLVVEFVYETFICSLLCRTWQSVITHNLFNGGVNCCAGIIQILVIIAC